MYDEEKFHLDKTIIVDGAFANSLNEQNEYANRKYIAQLRKAKIPVKVENWKGKMHCKLATIDDKIILTGSFNWTRSAVNVNDENFLAIKSEWIAIETRKYLENLWQNIPNKWLRKIPLQKDTKTPNVKIPPSIL